MRTRRQGGNKWFTRTFYSKERQLESALADLKRTFDKIKSLGQQGGETYLEAIYLLNVHKIKNRFFNTDNALDAFPEMAVHGSKVHVASAAKTK
jgi:hypothetical protein